MSIQPTVVLQDLNTQAKHVARPGKETIEDCFDQFRPALSTPF